MSPTAPRGRMKVGRRYRFTHESERRVSKPFINGWRCSAGTVVRVTQYDVGIIHFQFYSDHRMALPDRIFCEITEPVDEF